MSNLPAPVQRETAMSFLAQHRDVLAELRNKRAAYPQCAAALGVSVHYIGRFIREYAPELAESRQSARPKSFDQMAGRRPSQFVSLPKQEEVKSVAKVLKEWRRPPGPGVSLMDLDDKACKWPFEEGGKTLYCGAPRVAAGEVYCADCHKRAWVPRTREVS